jgi:hypothetical protein
MNPPLQEVASFGLANAGSIWSRTGDEAQKPGMLKLRAVVRPKDGDIG